MGASRRPGHRSAPSPSKRSRIARDSSRRSMRAGTAGERPPGPDREVTDPRSARPYVLLRGGRPRLLVSCADNFVLTCRTSPSSSGVAAQRSARASWCAAAPNRRLIARLLSPVSATTRTSPGSRPRSAARYALRSWASVREKVAAVSSADNFRICRGIDSPLHASLSRMLGSRRGYQFSLDAGRRAC